MSLGKWLRGEYRQEALARIAAEKLGGVRLVHDHDEAEVYLSLPGRPWTSLVGVTATIAETATVESHVSAGRVLAGGVLFGPAGAIVGALAKKSRRGPGVILIDGPDFQAALPFDGSVAAEAWTLVSDINTAARLLMTRP